jgi:CheY-like chemotaxis protein
MSATRLPPLLPTSLASHELGPDRQQDRQSDELHGEQPVTGHGRILVVEPTGPTADALCRRVETLGHTLVGLVSDAGSAVQLAPRLSPDIVVLGPTTARELAGTPRLSDLREKLDCPCVFEEAPTTLPIAEQPLELRFQLALLENELTRERARADRAEQAVSATARMVHEINNLLSAIRCNAFLIQNEAVVPSILEATGDITTAVERSANLVQDLSNMLRDQRLATPAGTSRTQTTPPTTPRLHPSAWPAHLVGPGIDQTRAMYIVLVVDDDPVVRRAVARFVASAGYQVIESSNPEQGLAAAERYPVDLMITDLAMPSMSGYELARRVAEVRPGVRVIYMSGFGLDELVVERGGHTLGTDPIFLQKPFAVDALMPSVVSMLAEDQTRLPTFGKLASNKQ